MNYLIESTPQKSNASYNMQSTTKLLSAHKIPRLHEFYGKYRSPYAKTS